MTTKTTQLNALQETKDTLNECYNLIDILNGNLQDLIEVLGGSEHTCTCSVGDFNTINNFFLTLPTYSCMDLLKESLDQVEKELKEN